MLSQPPPGAGPPGLLLPASPRVDVKRFRADLAEAGVEEMIGALLDAFVQDCPERFASLEHAVQEGNARAIETAAHAFKSGAGTIRATFLADRLGAAEAAARAGDLKLVPELLEQIRNEHQAVLRELAVTPRQ